ncbi:MAG: glycosyltransferase [Bacteroidales bacterium]|nr:glycosyltransferase [Candidatus Physcousia equi]
MKLSVITIGYNNKLGYLNTFKSVEAQMCRDFEYIVVDGASKDGSQDVIKEYAEKGLIHQWVSEPDKGIYDAMNKGIAMATGEYMLFLNSGDSFYNKHSVHSVLPFLRGEDFYCCDIIEDLPHYWYRKVPEQMAAHEIILHPLPHQSTYIRSEMLKARPYSLDYQLVSDWEQMMYEFLTNNRSYCYLPFVTTVFDTNGCSFDEEKQKMFAKEIDDVRHQYLPEMVLNDMYLIENWQKAAERTYITPKSDAHLYQKKIIAGLNLNSVAGDFKIMRNALKLVFHHLFAKKTRVGKP